MTNISDEELEELLSDHKNSDLWADDESDLIDFPLD